jgi:hypothetical protein
MNNKKYEINYQNEGQCPCCNSEDIKLTCDDYCYHNQYGKDYYTCKKCKFNFIEHYKMVYDGSLQDNQYHNIDDIKWNIKYKE